MALEANQNPIEQNTLNEQNNLNKNTILKYLGIAFIFILLIAILSFASYKLFFSTSSNNDPNNSIDTNIIIPEITDISSPADAALPPVENKSTTIQPNITIISPPIEDNSTNIIIPETVEISSPADAALPPAENKSVTFIPPSGGISSPADAALNNTA